MKWPPSGARGGREGKGGKVLDEEAEKTRLAWGLDKGKDRVTIRKGLVRLGWLVCPVHDFF